MKEKLFFLPLYLFFIGVMLFAGCNNSGDNLVTSSTGNKDISLTKGSDVDFAPRIYFHVYRDPEEGDYPVDSAHVYIYQDTTQIMYVGMTDANGDAAILTNMLSTGNYTAHAFTLIGGGPMRDLVGSENFAHTNGSSTYTVDIEVFPVDH